jgi:hypothetical protein
VKPAAPSQVFPIVRQLLDRGFDVSERPSPAKNGLIDYEKLACARIQLVNQPVMVHCFLASGEQEGQRAGCRQLCEPVVLHSIMRHLKPNLVTTLEVIEEATSEFRTVSGREGILRELDPEHRSSSGEGATAPALQCVGRLARSPIRVNG